MGNRSRDGSLRITGVTRAVGIFGDPVAQTLSPAMHNAAFAALGIDMVYVPFHVVPGDLRAAVKSIRALGMRGVNVTIPHKEKVLKLLDEVEDQAANIGAVNTIVNNGGVLLGYNTDGMGYLLSLRDELGFTSRGKNIVIIGAGGAARSIFYNVLAERPASVVLANRTLKRAKALAREFSSKARGAEVEVTGLDRKRLGVFMEGADLVVNTTSIGMMDRGELDLPMERLPESAIVSDIVYKPLETALIRKAEERGLRTHKGIGMLVRQGAIAFELWTGRAAPLDVMRSAALRSLG